MGVCAGDLADRKNSCVVFCREESESIMELKNLTGSTTLPPGTLALGAEGIKKGMSSFLRLFWLGPPVFAFFEVD